jgi:hypothetical protein
MGDFSCNDDPRPGRPLAILGSVLSKLLYRNPFSGGTVTQGGEKVHAPALGDQLKTEILLPSESARCMANVAWDYLAPIVSQPTLTWI